MSDFSEFHEVVPEVEKRLQTIFAIAWDVDSEAFLTKPFFKIGRCLALVLNDGEFHSIPVYLELAGGLSVFLTILLSVRITTRFRPAFLRPSLYSMASPSVTS